MKSPLELYQKVLVEEFIRELQFLVDVAQGRSQGRADFTDKLLGLTKDYLLGAIADIPIPGVSWLVKGIEYKLNLANETRKEKVQNQAQKQAYAIDQTQLKILLETVAMEAARRYQFWICERLSEEPLEGIIPFAKSGVERMLEYVLRTKCDLTEENLLMGLMAGRSGAFVSGYRNTELSVKEDTRSGTKQALKQKLSLGHYTAEGAYGRTGFKTLDGQLWALADKKQAFHRDPSLQKNSRFSLQRLFDFGYTKFIDQTQDPKYGYMLVPVAVKDAFYGHLPKPRTQQKPDQLSAQFKSHLDRYQPIWVTIGKPELEAFLKMPKTTSLLSFCQQTYPKAERVFYVADRAEDWDLTEFDFEGRDLSDSVLNHCIFGNSLKHVQFCRSELKQADLSKVQSAEKINFSQAHLEYIQASGVNFKGAQFVQTQCQYGDFTGANFQETQLLGTQWDGAILDELQTDNLSEIKQVQAQQAEIQNQQTQALHAIWQSQSEQASQIQSLESRLIQLETLKGTHPEAENSQLQTLIVQQLQEQQARLAFERYCRTEIQLLTQQGEHQDSTQGEQAAKLQALSEQLSLLDAQKTEQEATVQKLLDQTQDLAKEVVHHDLRLQQLEKGKVLELVKLSSSIKAHLMRTYQGEHRIKGVFGPEFEMEAGYVNLQMIYTAQVIREEKPEGESEKDKAKAKAKAKDKDKDKEKMDKHKFRDERLSSFEDLFGEKRALELTDLFKPANQIFKEDERKQIKLAHENPTESPKLIFIQGRAGVGKTTCVKFLGHQWACGNLLQTYEWVFLLKFRQLRNDRFLKAAERGETYALSEWVYQALFAGTEIEQDEFKAFWKLRLESALAEGKILFVLDGLDELPESHPCEAALQRLLSGKSPVILTSRPHHLRDELSKQRRELEVIGFSNENIERYAHQYFKSEDSKAKALVELLRSNPSLWGVAHIPVSLNLLCGLYEEVDPQQFGQLDTMSQMYRQMEEKLLRHAALDRNFETLPKLKNLKKYNLIDQLKRVNESFAPHHQFLGSLAFEGLKRQQLILSRDLREVALQACGIAEEDKLEFLDQVKALGFIKPVIEGDASAGSEMAYEFIHLTFQEYFAAAHLAESLQKDEAFAWRWVKQNQSNRQYQIVFPLIAGLLKLSKDRKTFERYQAETELEDLVGEYALALMVRSVEESWDEASPAIQKKLAKIVQRFEWWHKVLNKKLSLSSPEKSLFLQNISRSPKVREYLSQQAQLVKKLLKSLMPMPWQINKHTLVFLGCAQVVPAQVIQALRDRLSWHVGRRDPAAVALLPRRTDLALSFYDKLLLPARKAAVQALGSLGKQAATPEVVKALLGALGDADWSVREAAVQALGSLGKQAATPELIKALLGALGDEKGYVRREAAWALSSLGQQAAKPEVVQALLRALGDEDRYVRLNAAGVLGFLGERAATPEVVHALLEALGHEPLQALGPIMCALEGLGEQAATPEIIQVLLGALRDQDVYTRCIAVKAFAALGTKAVVPEVIQALTVALGDSHGSVREAAVQALRSLGKQAATPEVAQALPEVVQALPEVVQALLGMLRYKNHSMYHLLEEALHKFGFEGVILEVFKASLTGDRIKSVRRAAAESLGKFGAQVATPEVIQALLRALGDRSGYVRCAAAEALMKLGERAATSEVIQAILGALRYEDSDTRKAVEALGTWSSDLAVALNDFLEPNEMLLGHCLLRVALSFLAASLSLEVFVNSEAQAYCLSTQGSSYTLSPRQAQVIRRGLPMCYALLASEGLSPQLLKKLNRFIHSLPSLKKDRLMFDHVWKNEAVEAQISPQDQAFFKIHQHLANKLGTVKGQGYVADFGSLLMALQKSCQTAVVSNYIRVSSSYRPSRFKRGHYYQYRQALTELNLTNLKSQFEEYVDYLKGGIESQECGVQIETLRGQLAEKLGLREVPAPKTAQVFGLALSGIDPSEELSSDV